MKTIKLYGKLGKIFGKIHTLDVRSPAEAVRAMCAIIPNFKDYLQNGPGKSLPYSVYVGHEDSTVVDYQMPCSDDKIIRIIPIISGAGNGFKIILGVALIAFSGGLGATALATTLGITNTSIASFGFSLLLGGIAGVLFAPSRPDVASYESVSNAPSFTFDGPINTTRQGNAIAVGYGKLRVGSQVISAGLEAQELV